MATTVEFHTVRLGFVRIVGNDPLAIAYNWRYFTLEGRYQFGAQIFLVGPELQGSAEALEEMLSDFRDQLFWNITSADTWNHCTKTLDVQADIVFVIGRDCDIKQWPPLAKVTRANGTPAPLSGARVPVVLMPVSASPALNKPDRSCDQAAIVAKVVRLAHALIGSVLVHSLVGMDWSDVLAALQAPGDAAFVWATADHVDQATQIALRELRLAGFATGIHSCFATVLAPDLTIGDFEHMRNEVKAACTNDAILVSQAIPVGGAQTHFAILVIRKP